MQIANFKMQNGRGFRNNLTFAFCNFHFAMSWKLRTMVRKKKVVVTMSGGVNRKKVSGTI